MKVLTNDDFNIGDRVRNAYGNTATVIAINTNTFPGRIVIDYDKKHLGGSWRGWSGASLSGAGDLVIIEKADIYEWD